MIQKTKQRVIGLLAEVLDLPTENIPDNASPDDLEAWDSLKHMLLVMSLEQEFEIKFSDDELTDLLTVDLITEIISERLGND